MIFLNVLMLVMMSQFLVPPFVWPFLPWIPALLHNIFLFTSLLYFKLTMEYLAAFFTYCITPSPLGEYSSPVSNLCCAFLVFKVNWWLNGLGFPRPTCTGSRFWVRMGPAALWAWELSGSLPCYQGTHSFSCFSTSVCLPVWSHFLCLSRLLWVQQDFWTQPGTSLVSYFCWRVLGSATARLLPTSSALYLATFPQFTFLLHLSSASVLQRGLSPSGSVFFLARMEICCYMASSNPLTPPSCHLHGTFKVYCFVAFIYLFLSLGFAGNGYF